MSKGNMYDWVDDTVNPLGGECMHKCSYCYVDGMKERFPAIKAKYSGKPKLSESGLKKINGKGKTIFVCTMTDLFAEDVHYECIEEILIRCQKYPDNDYVIQTKNPGRIVKYKHLRGKCIEIKNLTIGTTIESDINYHKVYNNAPITLDRFMSMSKLCDLFNTFITIEPIMDFNLSQLVVRLRLANPDSINIGADSRKEKYRNLTEPSKEKVLQLISELKKFTTVKIKDNLKRIIG